MNKNRMALRGMSVLFVLMFFAFPSAQAAEEEQINIDDLSPAQLRSEIEKIQTEFYRVFNQLNEDDDFDVECRKYTPTGSNIPQTGCEPRFLTKRRGDNANDYRQGTDELVGNDALVKELQPQFEELTAKMNALAKENQYFRELGQILQMLQGRLNELAR
ncbi:MAG: hypothetical protein H7A05_04785 [Pseudomonadales bacterium]|nr:hypothetical protein [Pseudomonadales bacterium]MCP5343915.1 hypothetical protein [Pseudomonadales bacterium]